VAQPDIRRRLGRLARELAARRDGLLHQLHLLQLFLQLLQLKLLDAVVAEAGLLDDRLRAIVADDDAVDDVALAIDAEGLEPPDVGEEGAALGAVVLVAAVAALAELARLVVGDGREGEDDLLPHLGRRADRKLHRLERHPCKERRVRRGGRERAGGRGHGAQERGESSIINVLIYKNIFQFFIN